MLRSLSACLVRSLLVARFARGRVSARRTKGRFREQIRYRRWRRCGGTVFLRILSPVTPLTGPSHPVHVPENVRARDESANARRTVDVRVRLGRVRARTLSAKERKNAEQKRKTKRLTNASRARGVSLVVSRVSPD